MLFMITDHIIHPSDKKARCAAPETARASSDTSGTDCWPTTQTMTAPGSSWIGSSSPPAASAGNTGKMVRIFKCLPPLIFFADATKIPFSDK